MKKNERVLITGAGRGIGFAIARKLAKNGYDLILNHRSTQGKSVANLNRFIDSEETSGIEVTLAQADIEETRDVRNMFKRLREQGIDRIDHLVLNAAGTPLKSFLELDKFDWKMLLNSNLVGNVECVKEAVPMMPRGSTITMMSSLGSQRVMDKYPLGVMKSAVENLVRYLEVELYDRDIRVNGICAGLVDTDMLPVLREQWPDLCAMFDLRPRRWVIEPAEVAEVAAFLIAPESAAIRGAVLQVDLGTNL